MHGAVWQTPSEEQRALRIAAARSSCAVRSTRIVSTPAGPRVYGRIDCPDGWAAARFLLAAAIEDASTAAAREHALEIRRNAPTDPEYVRAVFDLVQERVRFVREIGEVFARADVTLAAGAGDCDDHARVVYALLRAGGVPARLAFLYRRGERGPRHVVAQAWLGRWVWLETTLPAELGEHPYAAAERLGLLSGRQDIASEVRTMTEKDLPPVPAGFDRRTPPEQLERDVAALERLGFCVADVASTADPDFRRAVAHFQRTAGGLVIDGLIGPKTRARIAAKLPPDEFGIGYLASLTPAPRGPTRIFTHAQAREIAARAYRAEFGREPSDGELDFMLATAFFESGYGRAGAADWAALGQFASWASEGLYNWGALQSSKPGPDKREGRDAGRRVFFYVYPTDELAARALWRSLGGGARAEWLEAARSGNALAVAAVMKRHGYYEGFHVGPGQLGSNGRTKERGFIEEASEEEATRKNVADYAGALERHRRTVTGPGGVPDPSPLPQAPAGGLGTAVALLLVVGTLGAAWWASSGQSG